MILVEPRPSQNETPELSKNSLWRNQRGQGVVEYILVLVVVVFVLLGAVYQLNSAFAVWANNYFGNYLACLLETGELPSLGGEGTVGSCNEDFAPFSIAEGRPLIPGGGVNEGGGGGGSGSGGASSSTVVGDSGSGGRGERIAVQRGGGSSGGRSSRFGRSSRGGSSSGRGLAFSSQEKEEKIYTGSTSAMNIPQGAYGSDVPVERRMPIGGGTFGGNEEEKSKKMPVSAVKKGAQGSVERQARLKVMRGPKKSDAPPEEEGFTFGNFLRILLIAAIIIALMIFIGGQALQIGKSME